MQITGKMLHVLRSISELGEQGQDFTDAEITLYEHRYQEGYDFHHDKQYSEWVQKFYPENKGSKPGEQDRDFSNAEIDLYECRYQEGDDHHNERNNEWI